MPDKQSPFDTEEGKIIVAALTDYAARTVGRERAIAARLATTVPIAVACEFDLLAAMKALVNAYAPDDGDAPSHLPRYPGPTNAEIRDRWLKAVSAIAKAEGN